MITMKPKAHKAGSTPPHTNILSYAERHPAICWVSFCVEKLGE